MALLCLLHDDGPGLQAKESVADVLTTLRQLDVKTPGFLQVYDEISFRNVHVAAAAVVSLHRGVAPSHVEVRNKSLPYQTTVEMIDGSTERVLEGVDDVLAGIGTSAEALTYEGRFVKLMSQASGQEVWLNSSLIRRLIPVKSV
jgi:hypothetical protein